MSGDEQDIEGDDTEGLSDPAFDDLGDVTAQPEGSLEGEECVSSERVGVRPGESGVMAAGGSAFNSHNRSSVDTIGERKTSKSDIARSWA